MLKALLVYFVMVYKKKKFRPGTLVNGKRGGICCCKIRHFFSNCKIYQLLNIENCEVKFIINSVAVFSEAFDDKIVLCYMSKNRVSVVPIRYCILLIVVMIKAVGKSR